MAFRGPSALGLGFAFDLGRGSLLFAFHPRDASLALLAFVVLFAHIDLYKLIPIRMLGLTMIIRVLSFNTFLCRLVASLVVVALFAGCASHDKAGARKPKPSKRDESSLRLHLEVNADGSDGNAPISVGRQDPFAINVEKKAFLTEFNIEQATVVENFGGFSISIRFDKEGRWLLEQYTTAHRGKRMAIAAEFGELRWLAAPLISQRIADGLLVFTPDATREEADRIVRGLNRVAALVKKGQKG